MPVFCLDSVGTAEIVPKEFVSSNTKGIINNIENYLDNPGIYKPSFFKKIAEGNTPSELIKKINAI
jgi:hypothetical protein